MKTKVKKQSGDDYGMVHIKQYKGVLDRIELLEGQVKALNARLSCLLTVFNKVDATGEESPDYRDLIIPYEERTDSEIYNSSPHKTLTTNSK